MPPYTIAGEFIMAIRIGAQLNCWPLAPGFDEELVRALREAGEVGYAGVETNWRMLEVWGTRQDETTSWGRPSSRRTG
jgi:hypothetical protein